VLVAPTKTADHRDRVAGVCVPELGVELPALANEPDNRVERAYPGWLMIVWGRPRAD
jgi:hypothetical protein